MQANLSGILTKSLDFHHRTVHLPEQVDCRFLGDDEELISCEDFLLFSSPSRHFDYRPGVMQGGLPLSHSLGLFFHPQVRILLQLNFPLVFSVSVIISLCCWRISSTFSFAFLLLIILHRHTVIGE